LSEGVSTPVGIGVIGTGAIAQVVHLPILTGRDDVEVVAVADADLPKAETIAGRFGVGRVVAPEELVAVPGIDAVVISTPSHLHPAHSLTALEAGKHVLVERPLAFTGEGVREVLEAAEEARRIVMVGMTHRYRLDAVALRSFVAGGELGRVHSAACSWLQRTMPAARVTWRDRPEEAGGGALMDLGVPALDLLLWLLDFPAVKRVVAVSRRGQGHGEVERWATFLLTTEDGAALQVEVSTTFFGEEDRHRVRVLGSEGSGSFPPLQVYKQYGGRPMEVTPRSTVERENPYTRAHRRQLDHFLRAVVGEAEAPLPWDQVRLMELVQAAYRSAEEGREVGR